MMERKKMRKRTIRRGLLNLRANLRRLLAYSRGTSRRCKL